VAREADQKIVRIRVRRISLVAAILAGIGLGMCLYTFNYAEGLAYMSNDPKACVNCHIMQDEYDSWAKSGHHHVAVCNDCHTPHTFVGKYTTKAINGWNHSRAFTLQDFHEPIQITQRNKNILQENCIRCHSDFVHDAIVVPSGGEENTPYCVQCHRTVGHGPTR
jgi:cytochrome c nitrite reductase small subunit